MRCRLLPWLASFAVLLAPVAARAQGTPPERGPIFSAAPDAQAPTAAPSASVRLDYTAPAGCPDERELRSIVASHMGHDPFLSAAAPAASVVRVSVDRRGAAFVAGVELRDPTGRVLWSRPALADPDCGRLVAVLGNISIRAAIDTAPPPPAPSSPAALPPAPPTTPAPVAPPAPPAAAASTAPVVRLGARAGVAAGMVPGPAAALSADIGVGWRFASINVEALGTVPAERTVDSGVRLRSSLVGGALVPCGHYGWFVGCGVLAVGAFRAEAVNVTTNATSTGVYAGAGLRAALEWPIVPAFALRLSGDVLVNLHPLAPHILAGATPASAMPVEVWRSGPFAAALGAGVVARFGGGAASPVPPGGTASGSLGAN